MGDLITAGGWCAPMETIYDLGHGYDKDFVLPVSSTNRGGIHFPTPPEEGTIEYQRALVARQAKEALNALIARKIGDIRRSQIAVQNWAVNYALAHDYAVHVHTTWNSRFVGIEFVPAGEDDLLVNHHHADWDDWV